MYDLIPYLMPFIFLATFLLQFIAYNVWVYSLNKELEHQKNINKQYYKTIQLLSDHNDKQLLDNITLFNKNVELLQEVYK